MVFRSGRVAEHAARGLAFRLAKAGEPVRLDLRLRGGQEEARFLCLPPLHPDSPPDLMSLPLKPTPGK